MAEGQKVKKTSQPQGEEVKEKSSLEEEYVTLSLPQLTTPLAIIIASIILALGIGLGLYFGLSNMKSTSQGDTTGVAGTYDAASFPEASISPNNAAVKGDTGTAKVYIVEFSDFMCVYCRQFALGIDVQTNQKTGAGAYEQIVSDYVATGKVAIVYKHLAIASHEPAATKTAMLAECVRKDAGDTAFFKFHDKMFEIFQDAGKETTWEKVESNWKSVIPSASQIPATSAVLDLDLTKVGDIITSSGANKDNVLNCYNNFGAKDILASHLLEVQALESDLVSKGATQGIGTPAFIIGTLQSDGTVKGRFIGGAYPYEAFKNVIEEQLAK